MFFLLLSFSCDDSTIGPQFNAEEISPLVKYQEIEENIQLALQQWEKGDSRQAQEQLLEIYQGPFQELQPLLVQEDQMGLIQLEFTFGQTLERMKSLRTKGRQEQADRLLTQYREETQFLRAAALEKERQEKERREKEEKQQAESVE